MMDALPDEGVPAEQVLGELAGLRAGDLPTHGGQLFAYVYDPAVPGLDELAVAAYAGSAHVNGLDPTAFPSLLGTENALVAAAAKLLGGDGRTVGTVTSGGTESLLLAVKAARDSRPEVAAPRLVVPATAHAAFAKAAAYLRVALDVVAVDPVTMRPDPAAMAAAIGPDTVLVAVSAPSYAHGVVDPVAEVAALGRAGGGTVPRRRLLRRLDPAVPAPARRAGTRVRAGPARRHQHLGGPAQVRVRAEGRIGSCCTGTRPTGGRSTSRGRTGPGTRW